MTKKSISRLLQASLMCCLAVLFTACDDIFASEDNPTPAYLSMSDKPVTLKVGDTYRRKAISVTTAVVEYTSSDTKVATVNGEGMVTAIAEGTATITATATGYSTDGKKIFLPDSKSYVVTVAKKVSLVASITLNETKLIKKLGDAAVTLTATMDPDDATDKTVAWTSSNESVATVTDGVVNFKAVGEATITATATNGTEDTADDQTATCNVVVASLDLSTLTAEYTAHDGDVLTGTTSYAISIPDDATIYLADATVNNTVECKGDATIVLIKETENKISTSYTAIKAGPANTTLTLSGEGTLNATSGTITYACIGSQRQGAAGNIVIKGGIINATAANYAAAIGAGCAGSCQDITIQGGMVTARAVAFGAGIGTGDNKYGPTACRDIKITGGIVYAYGGAGGAGIGAGAAQTYTNAVTCRDITITGGTVNAYGGIYGAGIGTGVKNTSSCPSPTCGNITISGGTITATKGAGGVWDIGPGVNSTNPGKYDGVVSGTMSVTVTVKDKNGNNASIYAAP